MQIYFLRHGESEANVIRQISNRGWQHGLTPKGRQQAQEAAQILRGARPIRVFTSPLRRAVETAEIVARACGVSCAVTDALREYDCGAVEGRADAEAWEQWQGLHDAWIDPQRRSECIPGGESFYDVQARFVPFVRHLVTEGGMGPYILVGHGGTFRFMLPLVLANIDQAFALAAPFPNAGYALAQTSPDGLICLEWCGQKMGF